MSIIGEMKKLTVGDKTYTVPTSGGGGGSVTAVDVSNATNGGLSVSGSPITTSGTITIGHNNVLSSAQTTQAVYPIKIDKNGHVSAYGTAVTSMPASDVSAWAKASSKPTYTASEVGALPSTTVIPSAGTGTSYPAMDGTKSLGTQAGFARVDHVHPTDTSRVPTSRTVNGKALSSNITLSASDVGALPSTTSIPSKTSDLTNDSNFVEDASYVHTDNNFTTTLKNKLNGIAAGAEVNVQANWSQTTTTADDYIKNKPTIPTTTSQLTNNSGFITSAALPTKVSDLDNDSGFITGYTETDPTVPSWAKAASKPSYTASEVGAQETLVSGTNIKTVGGTSVLGSGDIPLLTLDTIYPVGSIYMSVNNTDPSTLFGGTWAQITDTFLLASGTSYPADDGTHTTATGGSATHTHTTGSHQLTAAESGVPAHSHGFTQPTVSGGAHYHALTGSKTAGLGTGDYIRVGYGTATGKNTNTDGSHSHTVSGGAVQQSTAANATSAHSHGDTGSASNLPPYLAVYVWKRTA